MTAHLSGSDREALRLAHQLREELRQALLGWGVSSPTAVSPFVDSAGSPSVIVRMDAESARALAMMLGEHRARMHEQRPDQHVAAPYPVDAPAAAPYPAEPRPADPYQQAGYPQGGYFQDPRHTGGTPMHHFPETVPPPHP